MIKKNNSLEDMKSEFIIYQNKKGNLLYGLLGLMMCLGSIIGLLFEYEDMYFINQVILKVVLFIGVFFFGYGSIYLFKRMKQNKEFLVINERGITDYSTAISLGFIPWTDIKSAYIDGVLGEKFIELEIKNEEKYLNELDFFKKMFIWGNKKMGHQIVCITLNTTEYSVYDVLPIINGYMKKE